MMNPRSVRNLIIALSLMAAAASSSSATVFTRGGWGWWWDQTDPAALGRGGTSAGVAEYGACGTLNPASIAGHDLSYASAVYSGQIYKVESDAGSYMLRQDLLPQVGGSINLKRLVPNLWLGVLFRVRSDGSYERTRRIDEGTDGAYRLHTVGKGSWQDYRVSVAGTLAEGKVLWGASVTRVIGTIKEQSFYDFTLAENRDIWQEVQGRLTGGWIGGAGTILKPDPRISLGGAVSIGGSSRLVQEAFVVEGGAIDRSITGRQELPTEWALGIQARPEPRTSITADLRRVLWGGAGLRVAKGEPMRHPFADATRWGAGLEHASTALNPKYTLRAGYSRTESYVRAADGTRVIERALTFGGRARTGKGRSVLDLAVELGKRGDIETVGVSERFMRITIGIAFSSALREY